MKYIEEFESTENINEFISLLKIRYNVKYDTAKRTYYKVRKFLKIKSIMKKSRVSKEKAELLYNADISVTKKKPVEKKIKKKVIKTEPIIDIKEKIKEYDDQVRNNVLLEKIPEIHHENERKPARLKMLEFENMIRLKWKITDKFLLLHGFSFEEIKWLKRNKNF